MKIAKQILIISMPIMIFVILTACGANNNEQGEADTAYGQSPEYNQNASIAEAEVSYDEIDAIEPIELSSHEYGMQVATEFLSQFTTLFLEHNELHNFHHAMLGFDIADPSFNSWEVIGSNLSRLLQDPDTIPQKFIDDMSFRFVGGAAYDFVLFDVHDNGIPLIGISNIALFVNGDVPLIMYNYLNGTYLEVGEMWLSWPRDLYLDQGGNIIALEGSHFAGRLYSVNSLIIQDSIFRSTIKQAPSWDAWWDLGENYLAPDMPLSDFRSTRMTELERQIREYLTPIAEEYAAYIITNPPTPTEGLIAMRTEMELRNLASEALPLHLWPTDGFIIYYTSEELIGGGGYTWSAIAWYAIELTPQQRRIARNEIFARHGRRFSDPALQAYFDLQPWYTPTLPLGVEPELNPIERENVYILIQLDS